MAAERAQLTSALNTECPVRGPSSAAIKPTAIRRTLEAPLAVNASLRTPGEASGARVTQRWEAVDLPVMESFDEDLVLPCEFIAHSGDEPARWILFPSCCEAHMLGCDACKDRKTMSKGSIRCGECKTSYFPAARAWRRIEPITK
jgi:hypothetical protein